MNKLKSSAALKADAREQLLGKYKTTVLAFLVMQIILSGCLTLAESQLNLQNATGAIIYYAVYFILTLLSAIFTVGQNYLYLNIARDKEYAFKNIWYGFRNCADRAILVNFMIIIKSLLFGIPLYISLGLLIMTRNYYLFLLVAAGIIFMAIGCILININYSQCFFLILDYPDLNAPMLMKKSKQLMNGHKGSYFYLMVSFLGIAVLGLLTFGMGMLWIFPYMTCTKTNYYLDLTKPQEKTDNVYI